MNLEKHCMSLHQKTEVILEWQETLNSFIKGLEEIKKREKYLDFDPIVDAYSKMETITKLKVEHTQHLLACEGNTSEVEKLLSTYNEIVENISDQMAYLHT